MKDVEHPQTGFRHSLVVRYGECDMQGVVFNANYLAYADDVCDNWLVAALGRDWNTRFDAVVKKAAVEWHSAARHGDRVDFTLTVRRWGTTSFETRTVATVDGTPVATIDLLYISVVPGSHQPVAIPRSVIEALSAWSCAPAAAAADALAPANR